MITQKIKKLEKHFKTYKKTTNVAGAIHLNNVPL